MNSTRATFSFYNRFVHLCNFEFEIISDSFLMFFFNKDFLKLQHKHYMWTTNTFEGADL